METKQEYYRKLVELEYGFLIESIEENDKEDSVNALMIFILTLLKLDMSCHNKLKSIEHIKNAVGMIEPLIVK
jgi:hypothetical protein